MPLCRPAAFASGSLPSRPGGLVGISDRRRAGGMPFHVRLLRRVLLLGSVLSLTGIHRDGATLPIGWRLSQLVPIILSFAFIVSTLTNVATLHQVHEVLLSLYLGIVISFALLVLFWFIWRRRNIHHLLRQVVCLESGEDTSNLYRPGDTTPLYRQMALLFTNFMALIAGSMVMRSIAVNRQTHFDFSMWVPGPLRFGAGRTIVVGLQMLLAATQVAELMMFTLLVAGLADGAALQLRLVQRALLGVCHWETTDQAANPTRVGSGQVNVTSARAGALHETIIQNKITSERVFAWHCVGNVGDAVALNPPNDGDNSSAVLQLRHQSERYGLVYQLVSDTADVFSAPLLWLHVVVAASLLLAGYVAAVQLPGQVEASFTSTSLCLWMVFWFVCLSIVADAGSRLIRQSEELRDVVAKKCWSVRMSAAARGELQVLLEQTRTLLALDVWGLFSVQKSVLLSVLSFVLTYFVIMLQMIR